MPDDRDIYSECCIIHHCVTLIEGPDMDTYVHNKVSRRLSLPLAVTWVNRTTAMYVTSEPQYPSKSVTLLIFTVTFIKKGQSLCTVFNKYVLFKNSLL